MLILKSASPRRKQVFENLKLQFQVEPSHIDENTRDKEIPLDYLRRVTIAKLDTEKSNLENVYVSSDTIVVLDELEIRKYLEEAKPYDKAGAYGIQDAGTPVSNYIGSYTNVLGFPIRKFYQFFRVWEEFLS